MGYTDPVAPNVRAPGDLAAEALAAVTGLWPRRAPSRTDLVAAEGMPRRWAQKLRKWLASDGPERLPWEAPPSSEELLERILRPLDATEIEAWLATVGEPGVALAYVGVLQTGRSYLDSIWPKIPEAGLVAGTYPLSRDDLDEVWSVCRVLDDFDSLLAEFSAQTLTVDQVRAVRSVFPDLCALLDDLLDEALIEHVSKKKPLPWQIEDVIRVWRGIKPEEPIAVPAPDKPQPPKPETKSIDFASLRTPSEKVAG